MSRCRSAEPAARVTDRPALIKRMASRTHLAQGTRQCFGSIVPLLRLLKSTKLQEALIFEAEFFACAQDTVEASFHR